MLFLLKRLPHNFITAFVAVFGPASLSGCAHVIVGGCVAVGGYVITRDKTVGTSLDDTKIGAIIKSNIYKKISPQCYSDVSVTVDRGSVLLTGSVQQENWITRAEEEAWKTKGVVSVDNNLVYGKSIGIATLMKDSVITSEVRTALLGTKEIRSANYKIKTMDGIVYLRGVAQTERERRVTLDTVRRIKGIKKIISYVTIKK
ncbi:MAG: BON domain-containing protein [Holosporales bacterium]|jgi:osmotically-inducible protein OsmY|nr:BON domain-containing protein [Holosporales bacterium]